MTISIKEHTPTIEEIQELRESVGWNPRTKEQWTQIISKSIFFSAYDDNKLVGIGRILHDGTTCLLADHCIRKEYQRKGIGTKIILARVDKAKELGCTYIQGFPSDQSTELFSKLGFELVTGTQLIVNSKKNNLK